MKSEFISNNVHTHNKNSSKVLNPNNSHKDIKEPIRASKEEHTIILSTI